MEELNGGGWVEVELFNTTWGKQYIEYSRFKGIDIRF